MDSRLVIGISVKNLLDFSFQTGDLGMGIISTSRAVEGTKGHDTVRKAFRSSLPEGTLYESEVPVTYRLEGEHVIIEVTGRIDGIISDSAGVTIHEIKTTLLPPGEIEHDHNPRHWAQAKCYAFMYASSEKLDYAAIHLNYYQLDKDVQKSFIEYFDIKELSDFFLQIAGSFLKWQEMIYGWHITRDRSITLLEFPYPYYREGQREFTEDVYRSITEGNTLFAQAPTGTGKTAATLYPAVKALGEGLISKIFYLTAKTTTRAIAEKALEDMRLKGLRIKSVTITAKEKICPNGLFVCDAKYCEYARDYFGKIRNAVTDAFKNDCLDRKTVEEYAALHTVCPFELSLELALWSDVIICDYNYLFDPKVFLKRFFTHRTSSCFLIDEAHNLVDRAREMFSAEVTKKTFKELKRYAKAYIPGLYDITDRIDKYFISKGKELLPVEDKDGGRFFRVRRSPPDELNRLLLEFTEYIDRLFSGNRPAVDDDMIIDAYFTCLGFTRIFEVYDESFVTYYDKTSKYLKIKLFCADPSRLLREGIGKGRSAVFFSATLAPLEYFTRMLGGDINSTLLTMPSPFPPENLCVYVDDSISTTYRTRYLTYDRVAEIILTVVSAKQGNYMAFFPSFDYLKEVYFRFMGLKTGIRTIYQTPGMSEEAREAFLDEFEYIGETSLAGFAVMGGVFGEGIDLTGDRLSGAIITGVGLPQICNERNIIRTFFGEQSGSGFEYAYTYPGINRVLQAAGRVIRTETDRGVIVLIDERYSNYMYGELLPSEWHPVRASDGCTLSEVLQDFWSS